MRSLLISTHVVLPIHREFVGRICNYFSASIFFLFAFRRYRDNANSMETVNNTKCDAEKKPEIYCKPMNNCVAQLRENLANNPVSEVDG